MIGPEHGPEVANPLGAPCDEVLVKILSEKIDAVRAGQVVENVSIEVGDRYAR